MLKTNQELTVDERRSLLAELSQMTDRLGSIIVQVAEAYGKTNPITKDADAATRAVRKLSYALEGIESGVTA